MGRRRRSLGRRARRQWLRADEVDVTGDARRIVDAAVPGEGRVVSLEQVVLISTPTGDAWILDPADGLARCLCRDGAPRPWGIHETPQTFAVEWELGYEFDGDAMIFTDPVGRQRVVVGYSVKDIRQVSRRDRGG